MTKPLLAEIVVGSFALGLVGWAAWLDWRFRRIPNWLTVPGLAVGILTNTVFGGWAGTKAALTGAGLGLAVLLPFVIMRGLGAGDWKLIGALGSFLNWRYLLLILFGSILVGGIMAVVEMVRKRRTKQTLVNLWILIQTVATFGICKRQDIPLTLGDEGLMTLPFGVAVALATVFLLGIHVLINIL